jgi:transposase
LATALVVSIADPKVFRSGRDFSAWIGLVPKQRSSGDKDNSKQGDRYLRDLFTTGALAVIRYAKIHGTKHLSWLTALLAADQGCGCRARQQDRAVGLGHNDQG